MRDPYDVLGLSRSASEAEIKKAFRTLAKKHHPDQNKDDPRASAKFAEVNQAYEILGDAAKRAQFDRGEIDAEGKPRFRGFEGFSGGSRDGGQEGFESFHFGFGGGGGGSGPFRRGGARGGDDIFSTIFGEAFRSAGGEAPRGRTGARGGGKGADVDVTLTITLEEIASDARKRITLPDGREVEVQIPKGVADGQVVRLRGLGQEGFAGPGDALLTLKIAPHARFTPEGSDLRLRLPVDLEDAVLGASVRVPTLTGAVEMRIPPMTSSGRTFRLRGKGLPGKSGTGDLLVTVEIRLPEGADEDLTEYARRRRSAKVA